MNLFKDFARAIYAFATTEKERQADYLAELSAENRASIAVGYFSKDAALLERSSKEYTRALSAAEGLVLTHHRASSFNQLCRSYVRRNSGATYFQTVALGDLVRSVGDVNEGTHTGGEASKLLEAIRAELEAAREEKSFVKRRSLIGNALKREVPALNSDQRNLAIELIIAIDKQ